MRVCQGHSRSSERRVSARRGDALWRGHGDRYRVEPICMPSSPGRFGPGRFSTRLRGLLRLEVTAGFAAGALLEGAPARSPAVMLDRFAVGGFSQSVAEIGEGLRPRRHDSVGKPGRWLDRVVQCRQNDGVGPLNLCGLQQFREGMFHLWLRQLRRRHQRGRSRWFDGRMRRLVARRLPKSRREQSRFPSVTRWCGVGEGTMLDEFCGLLVLQPCGFSGFLTSHRSACRGPRLPKRVSCSGTRRGSFGRR